MSGAIKSLVVLFIVQAVLTLGVLFRDDNLATFVPNEPLLGFQLEELSKIIISDGKDSINLEQIDGEWVLPDYGNFPVSDSKKALFEDKLFSLERPYPLANTKIAQKQFEVGSDSFKKKISFYKGEELTDSLLLGSSPGFRKIHVRKESEDQTYSVEFSAYDLQLTDSSWFDRNFLKIDRGDISKISFGELSILLDDNKSSLAGMTENEELVSEKVDTLIEKLSRPSFNDLGKDIEAHYSPDSPYLTYTIALTNGTEVSYSYSRPKKLESDKEEPNYFILKLSNSPFFFRISNTTVEDIGKFERATLVQEKSKQEEVVDSSTSGESTSTEAEAAIQSAVN